MGLVQGTLTGGNKNDPGVRPGLILKRSSHRGLLPQLTCIIRISPSHVLVNTFDGGAYLTDVLNAGIQGT
jgi:hypothetical protein